MTWNEFVSYVQLEIDKVTDKDPEVDYIDIRNPDNNHPSTSLVIVIRNGELVVCQ